MNKINIALMAGGDSSEREVSLGSAAQVYAALDKGKYNVFLVDVKGRDWVYTSDDGRKWKVDRNDFSVTIAEIKTRFDYALILIHGTPGEDGRLQGYFDFMKISYSTCDMVSTVITFDKQLCKQTVAQAGVPVAKGVMLRREDEFDEGGIVRDFRMPVFVKPNASGSSFGVSKVYAPEELHSAVEDAFREGDAVLVEEFVEGREIACGLMVAEDEELVLPLTEIKPETDFFDYQAKYQGLSQEVTPADIDYAVAAKVRELALKAYRACRCRGVVRVDFIVRPDGGPVMIEINSVPGMSAGSIVPQQAVHIGMTLGELFDRVIKDTFRPCNAWD